MDAYVFAVFFSVFFATLWKFLVPPGTLLFQKIVEAFFEKAAKQIVRWLTPFVKRALQLLRTVLQKDKD